MRGTWMTACVAVWTLGFAACAAEPPATDILHLKGHTDAVLCAAISNDATRIATGSNDATAIIWDAKTGAIVLKLPGHSRGVTAVGFSADGSRLVTGSLDQTARVWDAKTGKLIALLQHGHNLHVHGAAISPDGKRVLTASCDHSVVLWDVATEKPLRRYPQPGEAHAVAFSPDGKTFVTGCRLDGPKKENTLNLYDASTGNLLVGFDTSLLRCVAYTQGGKKVVALGWGGGLNVLNLETRKLEQSRVNNIREIAAIAPSKDGALILVAGENNAVVARLDKGDKLLGTYKMQEEIRCVAISPDGKWGVIAGGGEGTPWGNDDYKRGRDNDVKLMSLPVSPELGGAFVRPPVAPMVDGRVVISRDGSRLMTYFMHGGAIWWDAATLKEIGRISPELWQTTGAISGDGAIAAMTEPGQRISVYNAAHEKTATLNESTIEAFTLALSADGKHLFVSGLHKATTPAAPAPTPPAPRVVTRPIAAATQVHVYDVAKGNIVGTFTGPVGAIVKLELSPDGKSLLGLCGIPYGGEMAAVTWDVATGRQLWKWSPKIAPTGHPAITAPAWAADSRTLAFAYDNTAIVVDAANGKVIAELTGHTSPIRQMAFDPDGKRLWSGAEKDAVHIWDWASGKKLGEATGAANFGVFRFEGGHHELIQLAGQKLTRFDLDQKQ